MRNPIQQFVADGTTTTRSTRKSPSIINSPDTPIHKSSLSMLLLYHRWRILLWMLMIPQLDPTKFGDHRIHFAPDFADNLGPSNPRCDRRRIPALPWFVVDPGGVTLSVCVILGPMGSSLVAWNDIHVQTANQEFCAYLP